MSMNPSHREGTSPHSCEGASSHRCEGALLPNSLPQSCEGASPQSCEGASLPNSRYTLESQKLPYSHPSHRLIHQFVLSLAFLLLFPLFQLNAQIELHVWHQMRPEGKEILRERIKVFESLHPNIHVTELYKENEELRVGFQASAAFTGGGPELVYGPADFVGSFDAMHILKPLEQLYDRQFLAQFDPRTLTYYNGHLFQIGDEMGNHLALVWNKKIFAREGLSSAPKTFSELIEMGKKMTKDLDGDGVIDQYGLVWNYVEPFFFIPFYTSFGGWVMNEHAQPTLNNSAATQAFQFVKDLRDLHRIMPVECDYEIADSKFSDGRAAMIINGAWSWSKYIESPNIDFGLAVIPQNDRTGIMPAPMVATKGYFFNTYLEGEKLSASVEFVRFITSSESQLIFSKALKTIPSRIDVQRHPDILSDPVIAVSIAQAQFGRAMPLVPEMRAIWDAMRPAYQSVLGGNLTAEKAAAFQQELAEKKIRELNEGKVQSGETEYANRIVVVIIYALGILLVLIAAYFLVKNFFLPLFRNPQSLQTQNARFAIMMAAPASIIMFGVVIYPFLYNFIISLSNMNMSTVNSWEIIGFTQYGKVFGIDSFVQTLRDGGGIGSAFSSLFANEFYSVFLKMIIWTIVNVTLHVVIGVFLAILLNRHLPGKSLFRVLLVLPWAVPSNITALTWRGLFNTDSGAINIILRNVFQLTPLPWLNEETLAFIAAIITNVWLGFPFMMVIALGGLQAIPHDLYEASEIDGASGWQQFKNVTVPLLKPVMIPAITLGIVWTFNNLNVVWLVSNGGQPADKTHILVSYVYRAAFNLYRYGYAAAFSFVIFLLLAIFSVKFMRRTQAVKSVY